jgi:hypothetical protein
VTANGYCNLAISEYFSKFAGIEKKLEMLKIRNLKIKNCLDGGIWIEKTA